MRSTLYSCWNAAMNLYTKTLHALQVAASITSKSETDAILAANTSRLLAVRDENTIWKQESCTLHNMRQDRDEPVRNFGARLRGQAGVCTFFMQCSKDVNYTDEILREFLTRGIVDTDVQLDLLGDCNQYMTLEEVLRFVEAKEASAMANVHSTF